ncbi:hypothetical protein Tco_1577644 [Tanacetum coccineum]
MVVSRGLWFITATIQVFTSVSVADPVTTVGEVVTTASVEIPKELTLAQTLMEIKSAKPKVVTTAATIVTPASSRPKAKGIVFHDQEEQAPASTPFAKPKAVTTAATIVTPANSRPKAKGIVFHDQEEQAPASTPIVSPSQLPQAKDKGKAKMEMFDKEMKRVNTFVDMDTELVKGKAKRDDDQEEAEMKKHMEIVQDDEVEIDAIPLVTKPPIIVEWKIIKEGKMRYFQLIRADGSSKSEIWKNLQVSAAYTKVNAAGIKVTTAERSQLPEEFLLLEG